MGERSTARRGAGRLAPSVVAATAQVAARTGQAPLEAPLGKSGLPGGTTLGRVGRRMGLETVRDLLFHLPRRYDDLREMRKLADLAWIEDGEVISARVRVLDIRVEASFRRRVQRTIAVLEDETGTIDATWFGRRYIERRLHPGDRVIVSGKLKHFGRKRTLDNPDFQPEGAEDELLHVGRIVPVYRLTAGLTANRLRVAIREALDRAGHDYPEYLPPDLRSGEGLVRIGDALEEAHYPATFEGRTYYFSAAEKRTTRSPSRAVTPRSDVSRSTSCSRSRWAWSAGDGSAAETRRARSSSPTTSMQSCEQRSLALSAESSSVRSP